MHPTIIKELIALIILVISTGLFFISIAPMAYIVCYIVVLAMSAVFAYSILKRTDRDEREEQHRTFAAEAGYIAGGAALLIAIAHGTFTDHSVDPWLFIVLVTMLSIRLIARIYFDSKN